MFWTTVVDSSAVEVDLAAGTALFQAQDLRMKDYLDIENALLGNGDDPRPGVVSFSVEWTAEGSSHDFDNPAQKFRGTFRDSSAQMAWTARAGDFDFVSDPIETSAADYAELGVEHNGSFY